MACRGVHFALTKEQESKLLTLTTNKELLDYIQGEVEESWDEEWLVQMDKAWNAIHRCLTDGTLNVKGSDIYEKCILGGKSLYTSDDYIITYISSGQVQEVARAINDIAKSTFRNKYFGMKKKFLWIDLTDYDGPLNEEDFEYTWSYFEDLRCFFAKVANTERSIIFTVDQ